jgi:hypothetical protein
LGSWLVVHAEASRQDLRQARAFPPVDTAGCVSVSYTGMRRIIWWLDPEKTPRIVMEPRAAVTRM